MERISAPKAGVDLSALIGNRARWSGLTDAQLLSECTIDTYRASGPGGQKRNKTSSAVRLRHHGSGLIVIAEESRSQHENKARALRRLRHAFYLQLREPIVEGDRVKHEGRLRLGRRDPQFWPTVGVVLDALLASGARVSEAAKLMETSTGNLVRFMSTDPKVWQQANHLRQQFGLKPLVPS